jgi:hypothetical protein
MFLFQGLEKSLRLSGTLIVRLLQPPAWPALSTSLTGVTVWPAQDIDLTSVAQAVSRASFRCVCSWVLARKAVCWFLGPVALKWLRGFNQLGSWVGDVCGKSCSSCWSLYLLREEFLSAPIPSPSLVRRFGPSIVNLNGEIRSFICDDWSVLFFSFSKDHCSFIQKNSWIWILYLKCLLDVMKTNMLRDDRLILSRMLCICGWEWQRQ